MSLPTCSVQFTSCNANKQNSTEKHTCFSIQYHRYSKKSMFYLTFLTNRPFKGTIEAGLEKRMPFTNERFFTSTRGHIITLLRRAGHTVDELARALQLTDNAVRSHLATLERDGLVRQSGARHGSGKPAYVYELTSEADQLFPKPYAQVLLQLLDVLSERGTAQEREELLRTVGQRFATQWRQPGGTVEMRLERAVEVLNQLGGLAELERSDGSAAIHGYSCPFAAVVSNHPEVCQLAETLLTELVGVTVQQRCDRHGSPHCSFVVQMPSTETAR
jgi:predicted ArsR family transcriptional regulator